MHICIHTIYTGGISINSIANINPIDLFGRIKLYDKVRNRNNNFPYIK